MWTLQGTCRYRREVCKGNWEPQSRFWALLWSIALSQVFFKYLTHWKRLSPTPRSKVVQTSCFILAGLTLFFLESWGRGSMLCAVAAWKNYSLVVLGDWVWLADVFLQGDYIHTTHRMIFYNGDMQTTCLDAARELRMVFKRLSTKKNIWERPMRPQNLKYWFSDPL